MLPCSLVPCSVRVRNNACSRQRAGGGGVSSACSPLTAGPSVSGPPQIVGRPHLKSVPHCPPPPPAPLPDPHPREPWALCAHAPPPPPNATDRTRRPGPCNGRLKYGPPGSALSTCHPWRGLGCTCDHSRPPSHKALDCFSVTKVARPHSRRSYVVEQLTAEGQGSPPPPLPWDRE